MVFYDAIANSTPCEELLAITICETMHWDYWTFLKQPVRFIENIQAYLNTKALINREWWEQNKPTIPRHGIR